MAHKNPYAIKRFNRPVANDHDDDWEIVDGEDDKGEVYEESDQAFFLLALIDLLTKIIEAQGNTHYPHPQ